MCLRGVAGFVLRSGLCVLLMAGSSSAQPVAGADESSPLPAADGQAAGQAVTIPCTSTGERVHCAADTSAGVLLVDSTGAAACLLGKTWGYDDTGIWVSDGCGGEFQTGRRRRHHRRAPSARRRASRPSRIETWGEFDPGKGFLVGRSGARRARDQRLRADSLHQPDARHADIHRPSRHRSTRSDGRNDICSRTGSWSSSRAGSALRKLVYNDLLLDREPDGPEEHLRRSWATSSRAASACMRASTGCPGTRSLQGSHPYWLGHDRVMADEFFRPFFTNGVWAQGETAPGLWYNVMVGNNLSALGIKATQLDRKFAHRRLDVVDADDEGVRSARRLRRLGVSREGGDAVRLLDDAKPRSSATRTRRRARPDNTLIRLADSVNVFDTGALAPGVTVQNVNYRVLSFDAGLKYKGFFLQTEIYNRWLDDFKADGPLPVSSIHDYRLLRAGRVLPGSEEARALRARRRRSTATSRPASATAASTSAAANYYPFDTRNHRLNVQVHQREPLAGQQHVRLLRRRPDRHDVLDGVLDLLLTRADMRMKNFPHALYGVFALAGCALLAWGLTVSVAPVAVRAQAPGAANEFNDSHFHLTNYIQQGLTPREFLQIMGTRVGRSTLFGIPLQQQWSYAQLGRLRADLLPAERRAALLLLVHRRLHRDASTGR